MWAVKLSIAQRLPHLEISSQAEAGKDRAPSAFKPRRCLKLNRRPLAVLQQCSNDTQAMASAQDIQTLLRFLSQDAKIPLTQAMGKVKELQTAKLVT